MDAVGMTSAVGRRARCARGQPEPTSGWRSPAARHTRVCRGQPNRRRDDDRPPPAADKRSRRWGDRHTRPAARGCRAGGADVPRPGGADVPRPGGADVPRPGGADVPRADPPFGRRPAASPLRPTLRGASVPARGSEVYRVHVIGLCHQLPTVVGVPGW